MLEQNVELVANMCRRMDRSCWRFWLYPRIKQIFSQMKCVALVYGIIRIGHAWTRVMFTPCWAESTKPPVSESNGQDHYAQGDWIGFCIDLLEKGKIKSNMQTQVLVFAHVLCIF